MNHPRSKISVRIHNEIYKVQQVEFEDETFFFVKSFGEVVCMIMQNEKGEWEADCEISQELFKQIKNCIRHFC